jgi:DNA-binding NtrC family response regulator
LGFKSRTILCVERPGAQREERAAALKAAGYKVILIDDAKEALRIFISQELAAVLMDLRLGNGKKTSLRSEMNSIRPHVPIIALRPVESKSKTVSFFHHTFRDGKGNAGLIELLRDLLL